MSNLKIEGGREKGKLHICFFYFFVNVKEKFSAKRNILRVGCTKKVGIYLGLTQLIVDFSNLCINI